MLVKEAMTKNPVVCSAATPLREVAALFRKHHIGGLPVVENTGLAGIITESDLISLLETERISDDLWLPSPFEVIEIPIREYINWEKTRHALTNIGDMPAENVMTRNVITVTEDMDIEGAAALMRKHRITRLPVLRGKDVAGIITRADIINAIGGSYSGTEGGS
jgi:CBS domain-containing protein